MPWTSLKQAIGLFDGVQLRGVLDQLKETLGLERDATRRSSQSRIAFTIAVVTLAAKMSKADGVSLPKEAEVFEQQFSVPENERANLRKLYELASQDIAGYEIYAGKIARLLENEPE